MMDQSRTEIITGMEGVKKLRHATVAVFGLGGVGGYSAEALARAGVGRFILLDYDTVAPSDINRQILSLVSTIGKYKTDVAEERIKDINSRAEIIKITKRLLPENINEIIPWDYKSCYAIDAIDELDSKVSLIYELQKRKIPFVSSMGAGNRLCPTGVEVCDISKTEYCPLARTLRKKLKSAGITSGVRCIYSKENLKTLTTVEDDKGLHKKIQGSISYMPGIFGLTAAGVIINDILKAC